jgi:glycosyltransferase involved in cell wall biosynthesis
MLTTKPLVSIGMPVYNGMKFYSKKKINFEKALCGILNQSYSNLEIIISNNCSNDETLNIIKKYLKKDKRIKFYNQKKNISSINNFRFVLSKAKGEYFKFNAHDDLISKDFILRNLNFLLKNNDYAFCSSPFYIQENKKRKNLLKIKFLEGNTYDRIKNFFKIAIFSQACFCALFRKKYLENNVFGNNTNLIHLKKDIICIDWLNTIQVLINGRFKTIKQGKLIIGANGISNQIGFIKDKITIAGKNRFGILFRYFFPIIDFNIAFFKIIVNLKTISNFKKMHLNYLSFSYNWFFFKIVIKKILFKKK